MVMWKLKGCPHCGGDIFFEEVNGRWSERCLQCGYLCDMVNLVELKRLLEKGKKLTPAKRQ